MIFVRENLVCVSGVSVVYRVRMCLGKREAEEERHP